MTASTSRDSHWALLALGAVCAWLGPFLQMHNFIFPGRQMFGIMAMDYVTFWGGIACYLLVFMISRRWFGTSGVSRTGLSIAIFGFLCIALWTFAATRPFPMGDQATSWTGRNFWLIKDAGWASNFLGMLSLGVAGIWLAVQGMRKLSRMGLAWLIAALSYGVAGLAWLATAAAPIAITLMMDRESEDGWGRGMAFLGFVAVAAAISQLSVIFHGVALGMASWRSAQRTQ